MKKRIVAIALTMTMALSLAACGSEKVEGTTGTGTAAGYNDGTVTVTLTVNEGKVVDAKVEGENQTPEVGGKAMETMAQAMIDAGSIEVDTVAGATITSDAVLEAAAAAMESASAQN